MQPGRESQTAVRVCLARAMCHGTTDVALFSDPTALTLLPDEAKAKLTRFRTVKQSSGLWDRLMYAQFDKRANMMVVRTVAVDNAVRVASSPQLVILGAGLDGRAWRLTELRETVVFEVDHPDSQRTKRQRAAALKQTAREMRFVPVDFTRDDLDAQLEAAGHDKSQPTTWIWEGVVMYLSPVEVEATLAIVARRSAPGSCLIIVYHSPALMLHLLGFVVRRLGEPLRSTFTAEAMRTLLAKYGFTVDKDEDIPTLARALSAKVAQATRFVKHMRVLTATLRR